MALDSSNSGSDAKRQAAVGGDGYDRPVKLQIACTNLRHKLRYVDARHAERGLVDNSSDTRVFWCAKTQRSLGPGGEPVSPNECSMGRSCCCGGGKWGSALCESVDTLL